MTATPKSKAGRHFFEVADARLTAMEIMLKTMLMTMPAAAFKESYAIVKEGALANILNNAGASDNMLEHLAELLDEYEQLFELVQPENHHNHNDDS